MAKSSCASALLVLAMLGCAIARRVSTGDDAHELGPAIPWMAEAALANMPNDFPKASGLMEGAIVALACTDKFMKHVDKLKAWSASEVIIDDGDTIASRFNIDQSCNDWSPSEDKPLYVHWVVKFSTCSIELKYANKDRSEWCLESTIGHQKFNHDPHVSYLDGIGNFGGENWTDACGTIPSQTKVLLPLHNELLRELGVKWTSAMDAAFFMAKCINESGADSYQLFDASSAKVAATGKTFYQRIYGDAAFKFLNSDCAGYMQLAHNLAQQVSVNKAAQQILDINKAAKSQDCSEVKQQIENFEGFLQALKPPWKTAWATCHYFVVDLAKSPTCK